jgi:hypothetical protein
MSTTCLLRIGMQFSSPLTNCLLWGMESGLHGAHHTSHAHTHSSKHLQVLYIKIIIFGLCFSALLLRKFEHIRKG